MAQRDLQHLWSGRDTGLIPGPVQWVKDLAVASMRMQVRFLASLSGLRIWCCHKLQHRLQMRLRSGVASGCGVGLGWGSDFTPSPGIST